MRFLWTLLGAALIPAVTAAEPGPQLKPLTTLEGVRPTGYAPVAFSPDGKLLAFSAAGGENEVAVVKLWDLAKGKEAATLRPSAGPSESGVGYVVAFSPDGKTLAAGGKEVTLFDVATGKKKATLKSGGPLAFSPDGKTLAAASDEHTVTLWDVAAGKEKASLKVCTDRWSLLSFAFSPDGKLLAVGTALSGSEGLPSGGEVKLWDVASGKEKADLTGRTKLHVPLQSLADLKAGGVPKHVLLKVAALNGKEFATPDEAEKAIPKLLDKILEGEEQAKKYRQLLETHVEPVREVLTVWIWSVAFSPDGKTLASGDVYGNVLLWDVPGGRRTATLQRFNPKGREADINSAYCVTFSPDGKTLAAGTLFGVKLWDVESRDELASRGRPAATVWSVAFSPDGKTLATSGSKRVIGRRDPREGEPVLRMWEWVPAK